VLRTAPQSDGVASPTVDADEQLRVTSPYDGYKLVSSSDLKSSFDSMDEFEMEYNETCLQGGGDPNTLNASPAPIRKRHKLVARVSSNATMDTNVSFEFSDSDVKLSGCYAMSKNNAHTNKNTATGRHTIGGGGGSGTLADDTCKNLLRTDDIYIPAQKSSPGYLSTKPSTGSTTMTSGDTPQSTPTPRRKVSSCVIYVDNETSTQCASRKSSCMIYKDDALKSEELDKLTASKRRKYLRKVKRQRWKISLSQEKRAAKTLGIIVGCFILCWLPFFMIALIRPWCKTCTFHPILIGIITWLGYLNSALNPIIYTFFNRDFRTAFEKILCCKNTRR